MAEELLIIRIEAFAYTIPAKPTTISLGTLYEAKNFLVKIYTNKGIAGWGEGAPFPMIVGETQETCMALSKDFAFLLLGKDSLLIDERMRQLTDYAPFNFTCKSAFDMALHDVAAQYANKPLYKFLGGEKKELLTDETIYIESPERMAGSALKITAKNPFFIKVKLGKDNNAPHDVEIVQTIRRAIGNTIPLRLDANQGWSVDNAVTVLTALEDANVEFCEQPVHKHDIQGLKKITQSSPIKIMADESCFSAHDAQQLIEQQACDYINIKLAKTGSMVEAGAIAKLAALHNMKCMLGGMDESALALTANAHFACAHDSIVFYDMDYNINHLVNPVAGGVVIKDNYRISVTDEPGIGATVDESFLKKCEKLVFEL